MAAVDAGLIELFVQCAMQLLVGMGFLVVALALTLAAAMAVMLLDGPQTCATHTLHDVGLPQDGPPGHDVPTMPVGDDVDSPGARTRRTARRSGSYQGGRPEYPGSGICRERRSGRRCTGDP
jgi:hypothetical protein